jgi:hypothetical protein
VTDKRELTFRVRLSRALNYGGETPWHLTIEDSASSCRVVALAMSDEDFAHLLSSQQINPKGEAWFNDKFGKEMETQRIYVELPEDLRYNDWDPQRVMGLVTDLREAGELGHDWEVEVQERWNSHNFYKGRYELIARRWV